MADILKTGSSPLARGLRRYEHGRRRPRRIIPARAGFTSSAASRSGRSTDHPRSRGVYSSGLGTVARSGGSSPLARGLHRKRVLQEPNAGIIPARAGFTLARSASLGTTPDHPRSRGVYRRRWRTAWMGQGSSPLARGLRGAPRSRAIARGIIPARAGFTGERRLTVSVAGDHPRSRGVYGRRGRWWVPGRGSSPLARGLQPSPPVICTPFGIIPARAGFTFLSPNFSAPSEDHPRSRGVYTNSFPHGSISHGSSPLARGLRPDSSSLPRLTRIIPARAGFTWRRNRCPRGIADHPRSRGVYGASCDHPGCDAGSSPLARGLLRE